MSDSPAAPTALELKFLPYAQLVRMLVPSAGTVSIYGPADELIWCSDGYERPDLRELLAQVRREAPDGACRGLVEQASELAAYLTDLEDEAGARLGSLVVELAPSGRRSVAPSLLKPVVDCLEARLRLEDGRTQQAAAPGDLLTALLEDGDAAGRAAIERLPAGWREATFGDVAPSLNGRDDPLTGLLTRAGFEAQAQPLLDANNASNALLYVDVDHLHQVNEAFGFACGDRVLRFVAERIRSLLPANAVAGRLGADRFAVMLPATSVDDARRVAADLQAALAEHDYVHLGQAIPVSVTAGLAAASGRSIRHLVAAAEFSAKRVKQRGPGRIGVARRPNEPGAAEDTERLAYESFEEALASNALGLEAQPIMGLGAGSGRLLGLEIFVRMRAPSGEWLSAHRFLSAAEYYGMMPAIDRWVVAAVLEALAPVADALPALPLGVGVNVSADSLRAGGYPRFVLDMLSRARVPSGLVSFELKEALASNHPADVDRFVRTLDAAGARVSLDNFGAGAAAVAQLKQLPIRCIKIDGALLRRCVDDEITAGQVRGLVRAARRLGLETIAEQVESEALAAALRGLGVDYAQGHHFGRPAPLEDWLERLRLPPSAGRAMPS